MRSFNEYALTQDYRTVRQELANHLIESNVDVRALNQVFDIINEEGWDYNPAKTGFEAGTAAAGLTLGSALGPVGAIAGGAIGGLAGRAATNLAGKAFQGTRVEPMEPVHKQAQQAIDKLLTLLSKSPAEKISDEDHQKKINSDPIASKYFKSVAKIKNYLDDNSKLANQLDKYRNRVLDKSLSQGGGLSGTLKSIPGLKWLGSLIQNVPILNQDKGLRRKISQGMDALQSWATENPKKAAVLNAAIGAAGAATGVYGASKLQQAMATSPQPQAAKEQPKPEPEQPKPEPGQPRDNRPSSQVKGFPSGKVDNSAAFGDESATSRDAGEYLSKPSSQTQGFASGRVDNSGANIQTIVDRSKSWNDKIGNFTTTQSPGGQTIFNSEDGNSYVKKVIGSVVRYAKVNPETGQAIGRPSAITDYMRKTGRKIN